MVFCPLPPSPTHSRSLPFLFPLLVVVVGFSPASYTVGINERQITIIKEGSAAQPISVEYFTTGNGNAVHG